MNGTDSPAGFSASLLAVALGFLLGDGIAVTVIAAQPSIESPMTPIKSTVTDTGPKGKPPAGPTASKASVTVGSAMQEGTRSKFSPPGNCLLPSTIRSIVSHSRRRPRIPSENRWESRAEDYRWDVEGWYGGDYNRVWFTSEGQKDTAFKADYDVDFQLLYGRFIQKYYDFQIGPRVETQTFRGHNVTRGLGVIGIEGLCRTTTN